MVLHASQCEKDAEQGEQVVELSGVNPAMHDMHAELVHVLQDAYKVEHDVQVVGVFNANPAVHAVHAVLLQAEQFATASAQGTHEVGDDKILPATQDVQVEELMHVAQLITAELQAGHVEAMRKVPDMHAVHVEELAMHAAHGDVHGSQEVGDEE